MSKIFLEKKQIYTGIDVFRLVAAFLVIAIHTSPFSSDFGLVDFAFTRIVARVAVPFFFMTSGFFLVSRYSNGNKKLEIFLKRTGMIYLISIFLYIPLNIYTGYFTQKDFGYHLLSDIIFNGTFYHLWYLPAAMIGGTITWFCIKKMGFKLTFFICSLLYLIGLFGDSYYGISNQILPLKEFYNVWFQISDYTRNGVWFAPIFFTLGGVVASQSVSISLRHCLIGFVVSILLLFVEGFTLHAYKLQRHDSMYIFLIPCMYFLFLSLLHWRGKRRKYLRTYALLIYLLHPMVIVGVRLFAKILSVESNLLNYSLIYYLLVSAFSFVSAVCLILLYEFYSKKGLEKSGISNQNMNRSWIEINLENLLHNASALQELMPKGTKLMAVVKANAYGHGDYVISTCLNKAGVEAFAVASIEEGIKLREYGIYGEILILGFTNTNRAKELYHYNLTQTLIDENYAMELNKRGYKIKVHMAIDTGMHRLGIEWKDVTAIKNAFALKHLRMNGIFTHLCVADSQKAEDVIYTQLQIKRFYGVLSQLKSSGISIPKTHIQSSYGLLNYPNLNCDYVRAGIALYGVLSSQKDKTKSHLDLWPVLSIKSQIILIRTIHKGESVGYGRTFIAEKKSKIAIIPIGYADGIPRNLANAYVLVRGHRVPIAGRICMDQMALDITDFEEIEVKDEVTLLGKDQTKDDVPATFLSDVTGTISNELLSRLGSRLDVIAK